MGLGGLMLWAIDLDDSSLDALRAVTNPSLLNTSSVDFSLVPLSYLFPEEDLPADSSTIKYGLINFGGNANTGSMDPG
jgi:chitinase